MVSRYMPILRHIDLKPSYINFLKSLRLYTYKDHNMDYMIVHYETKKSDFSSTNTTHLYTGDFAHLVNDEVTFFSVNFFKRVLIF